MRLDYDIFEDNQIARFCAFLFIGFTGLALSGCGNGLASVTGSVSIDGQPITGGESTRAMVYFFPESGTGAPAIGIINDSGEYRMRLGSRTGVVPGTYIVTISATELVQSKNPDLPPSGRLISPRRYKDPKTSGLKAEVAAGSNEFDFDLVPDPKPTRSKRR